MTLVQRIRHWNDLRRANALLRRYNRPHKQSQYMTGRALPPSFEGSGSFAIAAGAAVILVIVALNVFFPDPAPAQCAQVVAQK
jgi:hypothetical protein